MLMLPSRCAISLWMVSIDFLWRSISVLSTIRSPRRFFTSALLARNRRSCCFILRCTPARWLRSPLIDEFEYLAVFFFFAVLRFLVTRVVFAFFRVVCFLVCAEKGKAIANAKNKIRSRFIYSFISLFITSCTLTCLYLPDTEV